MNAREVARGQVPGRESTLAKPLLRLLDGGLLDVAVSAARHPGSRVSVGAHVRRYGSAEAARAGAGGAGASGDGEETHCPSQWAAELRGGAWLILNHALTYVRSCKCSSSPWLFQTMDDCRLRPHALDDPEKSCRGVSRLHVRLQAHASQSSGASVFPLTARKSPWF